MKYKKILRREILKKNKYLQTNMVGYDRFAHVDTLSTFDYSLAGVASGMLTRVFSQPLDVIKIRFQVSAQ